MANQSEEIIGIRNGASQPNSEPDAANKGPLVVDKNTSTPPKGSPADGADSAAAPSKDQQLLSQGGAAATETEAADLKKKAGNAKKDEKIADPKKPQEADVKMQDEHQDKATKPNKAD